MKSAETGWGVHWIAGTAGSFVKCSPNESVGWPGVWRACCSHCKRTIAQVLRENHAKRKKSGFAVCERTGGRVTAGGGRYDKDDWGTWGTREKESIEKQNDKSQCARARGLPGSEREIQQCRKIKSLRCAGCRGILPGVYPFLREVSEMKIKGTEKLRGIERREKRRTVLSRLIVWCMNGCRDADSLSKCLFHYNNFHYLVKAQKRRVRDITTIAWPLSHIIYVVTRSKLYDVAAGSFFF